MILSNIQSYTENRGQMFLKAAQNNHFKKKKINENETNKPRETFDL